MFGLVANGLKVRRIVVPLVFVLVVNDLVCLKRPDVPVKIDSLPVDANPDVARSLPSPVVGTLFQRTKFRASPFLPAGQLATAHVAIPVSLLSGIKRHRILCGYRTIKESVGIANLVGGSVELTDHGILQIDSG